MLLSVVSWFLLTVLGNKCKLQADCPPTPCHTADTASCRQTGGFRCLLCASGPVSRAGSVPAVLTVQSGPGCAFLLLSVVAIFQGTHSGESVEVHSAAG